MSDNLTPYRPKTAFGSPGGTAQTQGIDLGAGALGAGNAVLFGLPEAALKALGGEKQKQITEAYKAAHPEYGVGETLGNVGSMFIPAGQIAKLASLRGKIAPLAKLGEVAAGAPSITQGLAAASEQAVPRAFGSQQEGKDVGQRALEAGGQIGLGGALGGVLEGVGKAGKIAKQYMPENVLKEVDEALMDQQLSTVLGKGVTRALRQVVGNKTGAIGQIEKTENIKKQIVSLMEKYGIKNNDKLEKWVGDNGEAWHELGQVYTKALREGKTAPLAWVDKSPIQVEVPTGLLDASGKPIMTISKSGKTSEVVKVNPEIYQHPDMQYMIDRYGKERIDNIVNTIGKEIAGTTKDPANAFVNSRKVLSDYMDQGVGGPNHTPQPDQIISANIAGAMKKYVDEKAQALAPKGSPALDFLKEWYPASLVIGKAIAREKMGVSPAFTPGSDTFTRLAAMTSGGDLTKVPQTVAAGLAGQALNKAGTLAGNIIGAEGASMIRKALPREISGDLMSDPVKASTLLPKVDLPPALAKLLGIANKPITTGTERAGLLPQMVGAGTQQATLTPDQNQQVPVIDRLPAPNFGQTQVQPVTQVQPAQPTPQDILEEKIAQNWDLLTDPNGLIEKGQPGVRQQFIDKVKSQLIDDQGNINYLRAAKALFPGDNASAKSFLDSYQRFATIQEGLPDAVKLQTVGDAQATVNKQAVINATIDTLKKGMDSKKAEEVITDLLNNPFDNSGTKSAKLLNLLRKYDRIGFGKGGLLERAGVLR